MLDEVAAVLYLQIGELEAALTLPLALLLPLPAAGMLTGGDTVAVGNPLASGSEFMPMMSRLSVRRRSLLDLRIEVKDVLEEVLGLTPVEPVGDLMPPVPWLSWLPEGLLLSSVEPRAFLRKSLFLDMERERSPMAERLAEERSSRVSFRMLAARADLPADLTLEKSKEVSAAWKEVKKKS